MTVPGISAFTRTPCGARSTCIDFVSASTAPFDAAYETRRPIPVSAITDDMFTIDPERCAIIVGTTARHMRKIPRALTRITRSQSSRVVSVTSPTPAIPALLKSTSMRPCCSRTDAASAAVCSSSATSTSWVTPSAPPLMSAATTVAPSRAKRSAVARPIPEAAPVTMQTFFSSLMSGRRYASEQLIRAEPGRVVVDRRGDDQLVSLRLRHEGVESLPHGRRRADERAAEHPHHADLLVGRPVRLDVVDRRRQPSAPAAEDVREGLLGGGEEPARGLRVVR